MLLLLLALLPVVVSGDLSDLPVWPKQFRWSYSGVPAGYSCVKITEPSDPDTWEDNYFCWEKHCANPGKIMINNGVLEKGNSCITEIFT